VNYRLLPEADPSVQVRDVAAALAAAQSKAAGWGADRTRCVLMGHSAGAHLVALLAASPALVEAAGAVPVLGTVSLDSAALDVVPIMEGRHLPLYDRAFGSDPASWQRVSPYHQLERTMPPFLGVCSSRRADACPQARRFAEHARRLGTRAEVLAQDLSHGEINENLGRDGDYTRAVETFLRTLDPALAARLPSH